jgi:hypothetical protein
MTNGNQYVTDLTIEKRGKYLTHGTAKVNGQLVFFAYNHVSDKMHSSSLLVSDAALFGLSDCRNWMYLVCSSIAHAIKMTCLQF